MLRRFAILAVVAILSAVSAFPFLSPTFRVSSMHIALGEFWRLPWTLGLIFFVYPLDNHLTTVIIASPTPLP
jgi:hypothetical protein